jgi:ABC-type ATPase with predicted acetyltransferase domain
MHLAVAYAFLPCRRSARVRFVMDHFGIGPDQGPHIIARDVELDVRTGDVVLVTGPSGSGKSSLLRAAADHLAAAHGPAAVVWADRLPLPDGPLVDALPLPLDQTLDLLSACGLGEARLLLRSPAELSDGQRYRFRLALGIATLRSQESAHREQQEVRSPRMADPCLPTSGRWLVADEFSSALDRTLARVVAFNLRRLATRTGVGLLLATTHEDIGADLDPDVHVRCDLDGHVAVELRGRADAAAPGEAPTRLAASARRAVSFFASCGSARAPVPTGRISLGGIIAGTGSARCGG